MWDRTDSGAAPVIDSVGVVAEAVTPAVDAATTATPNFDAFFHLIAEIFKPPCRT